MEKKLHVGFTLNVGHGNVVWRDLLISSLNDAGYDTCIITPWLTSLPLSTVHKLMTRIDGLAQRYTNDSGVRDSYISRLVASIVRTEYDAALGKANSGRCGKGDKVVLHSTQDMMLQAGNYRTVFAHCADTVPKESNIASAMRINKSGGFATLVGWNEDFAEVCERNHLPYLVTAPMFAHLNLAPQVSFAEINPATVRFKGSGSGFNSAVRGNICGLSHDMPKTDFVIVDGGTVMTMYGGKIKRTIRYSIDQLPSLYRWICETNPALDIHGPTEMVALDAYSGRQAMYLPQRGEWESANYSAAERIGTSVGNIFDSNTTSAQLLDAVNNTKSGCHRIDTKGWIGTTPFAQSMRDLDSNM